MTRSTEPLTALTAGDLMSFNLLLLSEEVPLREAARLLMRQRVSGAPVVNRDGRLVGVLSSTDFVRRAGYETDGVKAAQAPRSCHHQRDLGGADAGVTTCTLPVGACSVQQPWTDSAGGQHVRCLEPHCVFVDWQSVEVESLPADLVGRFMSRDLVTATTDTPLTELARQMVQSHVHRVIVVNGEFKPVGVVTTTDILDAIAGTDN